MPKRCASASNSSEDEQEDSAELEDFDAFLAGLDARVASLERHVSALSALLSRIASLSSFDTKTGSPMQIRLALTGGTSSEEIQHTTQTIQALDINPPDSLNGSSSSPNTES